VNSWNDCSSSRPTVPGGLICAQAFQKSSAATPAGLLRTAFLPSSLMICPPPENVKASVMHCSASPLPSHTAVPYWLPWVSFLPTVRNSLQVVGGFSGSSPAFLNMSLL